VDDQAEQSGENKVKKLASKDHQIKKKNTLTVSTRQMERGTNTVSCV